MLVFVPGWTDISSLNRLLLEHPDYRFTPSTNHIFGFFYVATVTISLLFETTKVTKVCAVQSHFVLVWFAGKTKFC